MKNFFINFFRGLFKDRKSVRMVTNAKLNGNYVLHLVMVGTKEEIERVGSAIKSGLHS